jgi:hypothetical protein
MKFVLWMPQHCIAILWALVALSETSTEIYAQSTNVSVLPFQRDEINRYSLDHLPRSLSIRQGSDLWLGYDLERAKIYKVWQAPSNGSGLEKKDFVVRSVGVTLYEDKSNAVWRLQRHDKLVSTQARYQGCTQHVEHFELAWELNCESTTLRLFERVPRSVDSIDGKAVRELRVDGLSPEESLILPLSMQETWKLTMMDGTACPSLVGAGWYRMTLP